MFFTPYKIPIRTGDKYVAVFNHSDAKKFDLMPGDRIKIKNNKIEITALVDVSDNHETEDGMLGLFTETWKLLEIKKNDRISINLMDKPISLDYIKAKLNGEELTKEQLNEIVKDIIEDDLTDVELTYFVSGAYLNGLSNAETADLTNSIVKHGSRLKFADGKVLDKHCIGGVPGNRTTMVVVPIITAAGLKMPKTSSRSITSPAGTADTMEVLTNVTIEAPELKKIAKKLNGFIAWGGGVDIASADDHLIRVRHPLSLDPEGMLLASIMAKKCAVGSTDVLIDIPIGPDVKIKTTKAAKHLRKRFIKIGKMLKINVKVLITDGSQPIGFGIGPILEAIDVMKVLKNDPTAPNDLRQKSLQMAGILLEMGGIKKGLKKAEEILNSGKAYEQMQKIIQAQGKSKLTLKPADFTTEVKSQKTGIVSAINNKLISKICRIAGSPEDKYAGIMIYKKIGDEVLKNEILFTIFSNSEERLAQIKELKIENPYTIK